MYQCSDLLLCLAVLSHSLWVATHPDLLDIRMSLINNFVKILKISINNQVDDLIFTRATVYFCDSNKFRQQGTHFL